VVGALVLLIFEHDAVDLIGGELPRLF
jgi:hypothetical protein